MLSKIQKLDLFSQASRWPTLVIIDPEDVEHPPALNMFDMHERAARAAIREPSRSRSRPRPSRLFNYIFARASRPK